MRNTTKVNPSTGIDFSKIRKYADGNTITDTVWSNPETTENDFWTAYNPTVIERWKAILQDHAFYTNGKFDYNKANNFIKQYGDLRNTTGYNGGQAIKGQGVKQYQQGYHNYWGFGNGEEFWKFTHGANGSLGYGDVRASNGQPFTGDDYFGAQTAHRQATFFTPAEAAQLKDAAAAQGLKLVELENGYTDGTRKTYVFEPLSNVSIDQTATTSTPPAGGSSTSNNEEQSTPAKPDSDSTVFEHSYGTETPTAEFKPTPWITDPLHIAGQHLMNELSYRKDRQLEYEKPVAYVTPEYEYTKKSSGFAQQQLYQKRAAALRANAQRNLTSDVAYNNQLLNKAEAKAQQYEDAADSIKDQYETKTAQEILNTTNYNLAQQVTAANTNYANAVAAINARRNADQTYNQKSTANDISKEQNLATSWAKSVQANKVNYDNWLNNENDARMTKWLHEESEDYKVYMALLDKGYESEMADPVFQSALDALTTSGPNNPLFIGATAEEKRELVQLGTQLTDIDSIRNYYKAHPDSILGKYITNAYTKFYEAVQNRYSELQRQLDVEKKRLQNRNKLMIDTEAFPTYKPTDEDWFNPENIIVHKQGGKSRFIEWAEHYRKTQKDVDQRNSNSEKEALRVLRQQLRNLNNETIVLLRAIFK